MHVDSSSSLFDWRFTKVDRLKNRFKIKQNHKVYIPVVSTPLTMDKRFKNDQHALYSMTHSFTQSTNYGKKLFESKEVVDSLKEVISGINKTFKVKEINLECGRNYFTIVFSNRPNCRITQYINAIKTITSRELKRKFPRLNTLIKDAFWAPNYFITTLGNITVDEKKEYIDSQLKDSKNREVKTQKHERFRSKSIA